MKSFDTWQGCISSTAGNLVTNSLGAFNSYDSNGIALSKNVFNTDSIGKLNSLAGGLASTAVTFGLTGEATFNVLNIADFGANASSGLFEVTFGGKKGFSSRLGTGGTDFSFKNLKSAIAGYKEANKVTDWKYGSTETSSTLNSINMLGYTPSGMNQQLAKDIWSEKLAVEYGNTGNDYGNYTVGENKIVLSENLLGGGREASAKLATVMSHEGTHYNGNRVEAIAHLAGADTYAQLNEMFKLQADTSFSMEMLSGIMNADNWKENTGDVDYWRVLSNGNIVFDGKKDLYDENGLLLKRYEGTGTYTDSLASMLGISYEEAKTLMAKAKYETYEDGSFYDKDGNSAYLNEDMQINTSDKFKAAYDFQVNYADNVWEDFGGSMEVALSSFKTNYELGNGLISNETLQGLDLLSGFNQYAKQYDKYMISYYNEKLNMQYNSNDSRAAIKKVEDTIYLNLFNDSDYLYNAFGSGGILNPIGSDAIDISTRAFYPNTSNDHGWGNPKGFAVDLASGGIVGYSVYSNLDSFLYSNSVNSNNPLNLNTGNEVRLFGQSLLGNMNSIIYGHLQTESKSMRELYNLSIIATENDLWRTYIPAGTQIGNLGNTGNSSGPHLHWEYRIGYQTWYNKEK